MVRATRLESKKELRALVKPRSGLFQEVSSSHSVGLIWFCPVWEVLIAWQREGSPIQRAPQNPSFKTCMHGRTILCLAKLFLNAQLS